MLEELMRAFVECRIKPYYLHHADLAPGTSHFRTTIAEGQALMRALRGRVSGLAQPTYVLDIPGGFGKVPVGPGYIDMCGEAGAVVEDINGTRHSYQATTASGAVLATRPTTSFPTPTMSILPVPSTGSFSR